MAKQVLDVGNCDADHSTISRLIESNFDATIQRAHDAEQAIGALEKGGVDLVLVNRILDRDQTSGLEIIKRIKNAEALAAVPVMLITNFPDHQQAAVAAGAEAGFGKSDSSEVVCDKVRPFL